MSQENVEIVRRLYDEFLARPERVMDPAIVQFFDPAVEIRQSASFFGTEGTFHGYDGLVRSAREVFETFRDLHFLPIRLIDGGDHVVATVDAHGYGKHSDAEVNARVGHVWTLRRGLIVAWHIYMDPTEALETLGLRE
jgi:ketosteroid isomerase-like protein